MAGPAGWRKRTLLWLGLLGAAVGVILPRHSTPPHTPVLKLNNVGGPEPPRRHPEFRANLGKCIDTLQADYPAVFWREPDMDIFTEEVEVLHRGTGLRLRGKEAYRRAFAALRWVAAHAFVDARCGALILYDPVEAQIRVRWHARVLRKGGGAVPWYVDGIGLYHVNDEGFIFRHELRTDVPVSPPRTVAPATTCGQVSLGRIRPWDHVEALGYTEWLMMEMLKDDMDGREE